MWGGDVLPRLIERITIELSVRINAPLILDVGIMKMKLRREFKAKEARMIELCELIAGAHRDSPHPHDRSVADDLRRVADDLRRVAGELRTQPSLERKRELAAHVKGQFHKCSIFESLPEGVTWDEWQEIGSELHGLAWIYQESKYSDVRE